MSRTRTQEHRPTTGRRRLARALAAVSAIGVLLSGAGLASLATSPAALAADTDSAVTVSWAGDNGKLQQYQPTVREQHLPGGELADSGKHEDFKDVKVTVSQTQELTDQVVTVKLAGLATTNPVQAKWQNLVSSNFYQLMQCWGPDPNAPDFAETCAFGGLAGQAGYSEGGRIMESAGLAPGIGTRARHNTGYFTKDGEPATADEYDPYDPGHRVNPRYGVPFRSVQGAVSLPEWIPSQYSVVNGVGRFFGGTSNEQLIVNSIVGRASETQFQVLSAAANPYLGCGADDGTGEARDCWLVIVPRGEHGGSFKDADTQCEDRSLVERTSWDPDQSLEYPGYGDQSFYQEGSSLDPACSFWDDRLVVPLDFQPRGMVCADGAARPLIGTELVVAAVGSWQSALCSGETKALFSLTTAASSVVAENVAAGERPLGLVGAALPADAGLIEPRYAPVTNTGVVIAFRSEHFSTGRAVERLRLTPRLVAKLLTNSYKASVPWVSGNDRRYYEHLESNPDELGLDPEFMELNPDVGYYKNFGTDLMVIGPQGDDGLRQLWAWIQADDQARAFLAGEPDESGMKVNPYYLKAGHPEARGGGLDVDLTTDSIDTAPKADQTLAPDQATADRDHRGTRVDSLMMNPYSSGYEEVARRVLTGDLKRTIFWDSLTPNSSGESGAWVGAPSSIYVKPGLRTLGATDAHSALALGLQVAELQLPNSSDFVGPTTAAMQVTVSTQQVDATTGVATTDFAELPAGAYPLAQTLYAAVDIAGAKLDEGARHDYAALIDYAAGPGQAPGQQRGQLPLGYAPLSEAQRAQATAVATELRNWRPGQQDTPGATPPGAIPPGAIPAGVAPTSAATLAANSPEAGAQTRVSPNAVAASGDTDAPQGTIALLGLLGASLGGLALGPFMLRRAGAT